MNNKAYAQVDLREHTGRLTVGVHLDRDAMRVVEVSHGRITAWSSVPYAPGQSASSPDLPHVIKRGLESYEIHRRQARLWVLGSLPSLQLRYLSVPKGRASQLSNMVYWTFRKEIPFDAALAVFDYDTEGEETEGASRKVDVTAYTVLQTEVDSLVQAFAQAGYAVEGVVIPHFAMRNLFRMRWLNHEQTVLSLYVGDDASSLQILKDGQVVLSRVFITGLNAILDAVRDRHPEWSSQEAMEHLRRTDGGEEGETLRVAMRAALGRLMQQVERSMSAYLVGHNTEEIKCIHVMGPVASLPKVVEDMGLQWSIRALPAHVLEPAHLAPGVAVPDAIESAQLTLATGVALSSAAHTPSILHTYVKREQAHRRTRARTWATAAVVVILACLVAGFWGLRRINDDKQRELAVLHEQIGQFDPDLNRDTINLMLADVQAQHARLRTVARNSRPIAIVHQLANNTPPDIRLSQIRITLVPPETGTRPGDAAEKVILSGLVRGLPEAQESKLASYVIRLEDAALFQNVTMSKSVVAQEGGQPVLLFDMELGLEEITDRSRPRTAQLAREAL